MAAETTGKRIGIGLRLAAKAAARALDKQTAPHPSSTSTPIPAHPPKNYAQSAAKAGATVRGVARGSKRFTLAVWDPLAHSGSVLWLEITGLFFALFAIFFGQNAWNLRNQYATGPNHAHFLTYAALTALFTWFTVSAYLKARQKEKLRRAKQLAAPKP